MIRKIDFFIIGFIYLASTFFGFAILRYYYVFIWNTNPGAEDTLAGVRVFFSAPMLMLFGIIIILKYWKIMIHRILGILFLLSGIAWAIEIIRTIMKEAA